MAAYSGGFRTLDLGKQARLDNLMTKHNAGVLADPERVELQALVREAEAITVANSRLFVQRFAPDAYFTQEQHDRMQTLRANRASLTPEESDELDALIDAELDATVARTEGLAMGAI